MKKAKGQKSSGGYIYYIKSNEGLTQEQKQCKENGVPCAYGICDECKVTTSMAQPTQD